MVLVASAPAAQAQGARGQATSEPVAAPSPAADDPWEGVNRRTYRFNSGLDRYVFAPVTHVYLRGASPPVRRRVGAVVDNLRQPRTCLNDLAQGHLRLAGISASRFAVNSTVGLLGLFDVAQGAGLPSHHADFGQTLGRYGARPGPYVVLPIIGPHDVRDAVGRLVDSVIDPVSFFAGGVSTEFGATRLAVSALDYRADAEPAVRALEDATDPYVTLRAAYTQRRAFLVREASGQTETLPDFGDGTKPQ